MNFMPISQRIPIKEIPVEGYYFCLTYSLNQKLPEIGKKLEILKSKELAKSASATVYSFAHDYSSSSGANCVIYLHRPPCRKYHEQSPAHSINISAAKWRTYLEFRHTIFGSMLASCYVFYRAYIDMFHQSHGEVI